MPDWKAPPTVTRGERVAYISHSPRTLKLRATGPCVVVELYQLGEPGAALQFMIGGGGSNENDLAELAALRAIIDEAAAAVSVMCTDGNHAVSEAEQREGKWGCDGHLCACVCHKPPG